MHRVFYEYVFSFENKSNLFKNLISSGVLFFLKGVDFFFFTSKTIQVFIHRDKCLEFSETLQA